MISELSPCLVNDGFHLLFHIGDAWTFVQVTLRFLHQLLGENAPGREELLCRGYLKHQCSNNDD